MKNVKFFLVTLLVLAVTSWLSLPASAHSLLPQSQGSTALERGYRTGYSDGYNSGFKDMSDRATRDYRSKDDYQRADRAYNDVWGPIEDYRDGYQQGYEAGYGAGFDRRPFDSGIPGGFKRRGGESAQGNGGNVDNNPPVNNTPGDSSATPDPQRSQNNSANPGGAVRIPSDTTLLIELLNPLSTDVSQRGDRFQARVIEPREYEGSIIEGRITRLQRPGKVKGTAELQLSFDEIRLPDNRSASLHAEVIEVIASGGSDGVGEVDKEGGVKGKSSTKDDVAKVGATTGVGAILGAIIGGGKGAAIGAAIGAGVGTGGVLSSSGKDVRLAQGQRLRIRTSTDTSIQ